MRRTPTLGLKRVVSALSATAAMLLIMLVAAPPSFAAPTLEVSAHTGLTDGQTITISGSGFEPNLKGIAIGQCREGYVGPADCNVQGGATFKDADASGNVGSFTIVVKEKFGAVDCLATTCLIAAAPLPTSSDAATIAANTYEIEMSFASAETAPEPETAPETTQPDTDTSALPKTGAGDSMPVVLLTATALLAAGVGLMLLVPGRRREEGVR